MKISIVTLNYNGSRETLELLKSFQEQTDTDFEIIVVDNASEEADFATLQTGINRQDLFKQVLPVNLIRNSENLGFSGGNNVGIRHALTPTQRISKDAAKQSLSRCEGQALQNGASWVVLLNNDTWVERDFIERLKAVLSVKRGIMGIPLIEGDRVAYCGKVQWLKPTLEHVYRDKGQETRDKQEKSENFTWSLGRLSHGRYYTIGGAMAVHKSVFEKIGLLDEKYFLYFEDADFSVRARKAGFDISVAENLSIHHHVSVSAKKLGSPLLLRYHYRNALYFNSKNGPWYIKFLVWPWSLIIVIKQLGKLVINRNKDQSKAILAGVADFYLHRFGKIK